MKIEGERVAVLFERDLTPINFCLSLSVFIHCFLLTVLVTIPYYHHLNNNTIFVFTTVEHPISYSILNPHHVPFTITTPSPENLNYYLHITPSPAGSHHFSFSSPHHNSLSLQSSHYLPSPPLPLTTLSLSQHSCVVFICATLTGSASMAGHSVLIFAKAL